MNLWREIIESLPDSLIVLSRDREPLAVNAAAKNLFDASVISRNLLDRILESNSWLAGMATACLKTLQSLDARETTLILDKRSVLVRAAVAPLFGPRGDARNVLILLHDLSHQREIQADASDHLPRLSAAGLAHEVKNPLTGIKGAAELLAEMFPTDARVDQYCSLILHGVNRITSLIEQVLAASGPARLKRERINIHQVLHQAMRSAGLFENRSPSNLQVEQRFDPSLPEIEGDAEALERVFLNLLRNSVEALQPTPESPGRIRISTAVEAQFRLSSGGKMHRFLKIAISDNGKGMSAEEMKELFTPFFTTKPAGTGLGLVISQRTISLHRGKLWAERGGLYNLAEENASPSQNGPAETLGMSFYVLLPFDPI